MGVRCAIFSLQHSIFLLCATKDRFISVQKSSGSDSYVRHAFYLSLLSPVTSVINSSKTYKTVLSVLWNAADRNQSSIYKVFKKALPIIMITFFYKFSNEIFHLWKSHACTINIEPYPLIVIFSEFTILSSFPLFIPFMPILARYSHYVHFRANKITLQSVRVWNIK